MKMEKTECSETSAYKIQTPGNYREENIQLVCIPRSFLAINVCIQGKTLGSPVYLLRGVTMRVVFHFAILHFGWATKKYEVHRREQSKCNRRQTNSAQSNVSVCFPKDKRSYGHISPPGSYHELEEKYRS